MNTIIKNQICDLLFSTAYDAQAANGRITEEGLAKLIGVSRMTVRDVIQYLKRIGLVENRRKKGIYLKELSIRELADIYDVRSVFEGLAGRLAAKRIMESDLTHLTNCIKQYNQGLEKNNFREIDQADNAFHRHILMTSGNLYLNQITDGFLLLDRAFALERAFALKYLVRPDGPWTVLPPMPPDFTHEAIIAALATNDPELTEKVIQGHVLTSKKRMMEAITGLRLEEVSQKPPRVAS